MAQLGNTQLLKSLCIFVALCLVLMCLWATLRHNGGAPLAPELQLALLALPALLLAMLLQARENSAHSAVVQHESSDGAPAASDTNAPAAYAPLPLPDDDARNDALSRLSHELRTPLTSINGFAELLLHDDSLTPEAQEFAQIIHAEAQRLARLVNTILSQSQIATQESQEAGGERPASKANAAIEHGKGARSSSIDLT